MPLLAIGLAATAVGTGLSIAGNAQDQNAIGDARATEALQQEKLQKQASGVFQTSVGNNSVPAAANTLASGANARATIASALANASAGGNTNLPVNSQPGYQVTDATGQPMTNTAGARATAGAGAWGNVVNTAADKLGSYGDLTTTQGVNNSQANNQLGVIGNKAKGDANLLPLEIEVASHKGDALTGWGSIVSALGSVASLGAASGLGAAGAAGSAATSATPSIGQLGALTAGFGPVSAAFGRGYQAQPATPNVWSSF